MRERVIEKYLKDEVRKAGGGTRKMKNINDPDQIVMWREGTIPLARSRHTRQLPEVHFVELKSLGEKPRAGQLREHARLRGFGFRVFVLDTKQKIDDYVLRWK